MDDIISMPVSGRSNSKKLAGAMRERYRENKHARIELCAVGMAAVNNAIKGVVELNKLLASKGMRAAILPYMEDRPVTDRRGAQDNLMRTVTVLRIKTAEL